MTTTILAIGDLHIQVPSLRRCEVMFDKVLEFIKAHDNEIDMICLLGDTLHKFANIREEALTAAIHFFKRLQQCKDVVVICGNHDLPSHSTFLEVDAHPFAAVKYWTSEPHSITIVDQPRLITHNDHLIGFVPYVENGRFLEALSYIPGWEKAHCIFGHQDMYNCVYGGQKSTSGDKWNDTYPPLILGHIHDNQKLGTNIYYPGTPMQVTFDEDPNKFLAMITLDNSFKYELHSIRTPIFYTCHIKFNEIDKFSIPDLPLHSEIKIKIEGTVAELKTIFKLTKIKKWITDGVKIQTVIKSDKKSVRLDLLQTKKEPFIVQLKSIVPSDLYPFIELVSNK
jgi:DNA repair exonuclease SbcCD nuclease subunit